MTKNRQIHYKNAVEYPCLFQGELNKCVKVNGKIYIFNKILTDENKVVEEDYEGEALFWVNVLLLLAIQGGHPDAQMPRKPRCPDVHQSRTTL